MSEDSANELLEQVLILYIFENLVNIILISTPLADT